MSSSRVIEIIERLDILSIMIDEEMHSEGPRWVAIHKRYEEDLAGGTLFWVVPHVNGIQ